MARRSTGQYPADWDDIARAVKAAAGWACVRCKRGHNIALGYMLTVHHLDMDKSNCAWWNLAPLCQRCHLSIQARVDMRRVYMFEHTPWFRPYVAGYYADLYFLPTDRPWVEAHADALIALGQGRQQVDQLQIEAPAWK